MEKITRVLSIFSLAVAMAFVPPKHSITGRWKIFVPEGISVHEYVELKKDGSYDVYVDGQIQERGFYNLKNSVFSIRNAKPVCGDGYWGKYKLDFHGRDSIHFTLIEDSCSNRRMDIVGVNPGLRRIREKL